MKFLKAHWGKILIVTILFLIAIGAYKYSKSPWRYVPAGFTAEQRKKIADQMTAIEADAEKVKIVQERAVTQKKTYNEVLATYAVELARAVEGF